MQWCGLKSDKQQNVIRYDWSPLMQWCGLKYHNKGVIIGDNGVTTDAVVWIEIMIERVFPEPVSVTTDAVVWIEILRLNRLPPFIGRHH